MIQIVVKEKQCKEAHEKWHYMHVKFMAILLSSQEKSEKAWPTPILTSNRLPF